MQEIVVKCRHEYCAEWDCGKFVKLVKVDYLKAGVFEADCERPSSFISFYFEFGASVVNFEETSVMGWRVFSGS